MMLRSLPLLLAVFAAAAPRAAAQIGYHATIGATGSTALVSDVLFQPIETKPGIGPTLLLGVSIPIAPTARIGLEGSGAIASLRGNPETGESADLGSLMMLTGMVNLSGPIIPSLGWRVGVGIIRYQPSEEQGLFAQGGTLRYLVGGGLDYRIGALSSWNVMASARYDVHRFTTDELRDRGFSQSQGVQRISLSIGLARSNP